MAMSKYYEEEFGYFSEPLPKARRVTDVNTGEELVLVYAGPSIHEWSSCHGHWSVMDEEQYESHERMLDEIRKRKV